MIAFSYARLVDVDFAGKGSNGLASLTRVSLSEMKLSRVVFESAVSKLLKAAYAEVQDTRGSAPDRHLSS